ncbi:MAG: septation regulator SpoVG [Deltaproteobacteria bacterium]|nr:septation regulator SpoVG [Deltaproteobacteria bacterium]
MRITEIKVLPVDGDEKLKAYVTIKLDDCFVVRDMKVIKGTTGYFIAMPAKKMKDGTYRDLVHPLDKGTRQMLEAQVLNEYNKVQAESKNWATASNAN